MANFWKNKKVFAYIALAHHTRFITPVMENLLSNGAQIKYIVGQAERSQEMTAIELGLDYSHIFDFITEENYDEIQKNYLLLKQTFVNSLKNSFLLNTLPVTVTDKTLYSTAVEYIGIRNLLKKGKPDICFALHELNRWGKMFAFWAKKSNIPFITLQEGLGYNLDFGYSGHAQYSNLNLVWGERIKRKMAGFEAPGSKIFPVGNTHLAKEIKFQKDKKIRALKRKEYRISNKFVSLLILSSQLLNPDILKPIFKTVSKNSEQKLFVKFHPACKKIQIDKWINAITSRFKNNIYFIHTQEDTYDLISMADVCVLAERSTTGLESIAFGKPLVKLDFAYTPNAPYSFVDQGVAVKMSTEQFAKALSEKADFSTFINEDKKKQYLNNELAETSQSITKVCHVLKKVIQANTDNQISPYGAKPIHGQTPCKKFDKKWSITIQVPDDHNILLAQLEAVAFNSENQGEYELLLLEPENKTKETIQILASLKGDFKRISIPENEHPINMKNKAAETAIGENLIFLEKNLAPLKGWLHYLNKAFLKHGANNLFGAKICNKNGKIVNAGMVIDHNNIPVSAYQHLNVDFPGVLKERSFQMTDYFIAIKKNLFLKTGGFTPNAGKYTFLDLCLKTQQFTNNPNAVIYLPNLKMIFLDDLHQKDSEDDSIYFYGKWNSCLWESEQNLYQKDGFSPEDLSHAKITAAMQSSR